MSHSLETVVVEATRRMAQLVELLCSAHAQKSDRMSIVHRTDSRGRTCTYLASDESCPAVEDELRQESRAAAMDYHCRTELAPEDCMIVVWIDWLTIRVEYERKPEEWR